MTRSVQGSLEEALKNIERELNCAYLDLHINQGGVYEQQEYKNLVSVGVAKETVNRMRERLELGLKHRTLLRQMISEVGEQVEREDTMRKKIAA